MSELQPIAISELKSLIGKEVGTSRWFEISQAKIDAFADVTEDWQFIHVDPARTKAETPFDSTIAHGFLTVSMLSAMVYDAIPRIEGTAMGVNYGFDKLRFLSPVPSGSRIRAVFTLIDVDERKAGELTFKYQVTVEIEGSSLPALAAEWLSRQYLGVAA